MAPPEMRSRVFVVIPLYNHAATVRKVAESVLLRHNHLLVVDDGSTDGGANALSGLSLDVLKHPRNMGKGAALLTAARWGQERGMTHMVCLDADGQHDPDDLPKFFAGILDDPEALFVGHRDFNQDTIPGASRFGRTFSNFWLRLQTGCHLKDTQSGFRAYPLLIFEHLTLWTRRYNFEIEVLVRSAWAGLKLRDIDIDVHYPDAKERISHFRGFKDNLRLTLLNTHLTMRSVFPWPHRKIFNQPEDDAAVKTVSVIHPLRSIRQLLQENSSPRPLAVAAGVGVLLGALPLIFCHTVAILFVCGFFRLNKVAAVSSSQLCMPPLVPGLCIEVGYFMRNGRFLTEISIETLGYQALDRLYEWLLGALVLAPFLAIAIGLLTYLAAVIISRDTRQENRVVE